MEKYVKLLNNCHNLVLTGAPGTGKTYLAREIAKKIIGTDGDEKEQIGFVQFHPSYDYTDFVEGLRPVKPKVGDDKSVIGFERQDGIFKAFCKAAHFELRYKTLVRKVEGGQLKTLTQISGKELNIVKATYRSILVSTKDSKKPTKYSVLYEHLQNIANMYPNKKALDEIRDINDAFPKATKVNNFNASAYWATLNYIYTNLYKKYVFIIDEINRGELSKIFGELFFSIDPGYRGVDGRVATQYQNLVEDGDAFKDGFYVPENVYIIGTMNDIDRSVESMDFAIRRRFAWCEVKADMQTEMLEVLGADKDTAVKKMTALNETIDGIEGLNSAYHIGPAYFLKLKQYENDENKWESLWEYNLKGVLSEYLRGRSDAKDRLEDLKTAYDTGKSKKEDEQSNNE